MLVQGLDIARELGFVRVLCVCDEDNIASERVIIKNGGIFENRLYDEEKSFCKKVLDRFINPAWAENSVDKICAYCIRHQQANRNIANHHNTLVQNKNPTTKNCGRILAL